MARPPVIGLFSGAGGLDLGVEDAGGSIRAALECDPYAVATLRSNHRFFPDAAIIENRLEDVTTEELLARARLSRGHVALVVGGPPCQPFSKSGYWRAEKRKGVDDPRASLVDHFVRVIRESRPEAFIFENVASLTHPSHREVLDSLVRRANRAGYIVLWRVLHAEEYGVPQTRSRLFVIGLKTRTGRPNFPKGTHWWWRFSESDRRHLLPQETAGRWLEPLRNGLDIGNEDYLVRSGTWAKLLKKVPPGSNYKHFTAWAGHCDPQFIAESKYWTFLLKLSPFRPSWTIQASPGKWTGPLHWENRRLTVGERAALQTFPRSYEFCGSWESQIRQIGNAVPPLLAASVVASTLGQVLGEKPKSGRKLRYKLSDGFHFDEMFLRGRGKSW